MSTNEFLCKCGHIHRMSPSGPARVQKFCDQFDNEGKCACIEFRAVEPTEYCVCKHPKGHHYTRVAGSDELYAANCALCGCHAYMKNDLHEYCVCKHAKFNHVNHYDTDDKATNCGLCACSQYREADYCVPCKSRECEHVQALQARSKVYGGFRVREHSEDVKTQRAQFQTDMLKHVMTCLETLSEALLRLDEVSDSSLLCLDADKAQCFVTIIEPELPFGAHLPRHRGDLSGETMFKLLDFASEMSINLDNFFDEGFRYFGRRMRGEQDDSAENHCDRCNKKFDLNDVAIARCAKCTYVPTIALSEEESNQCDKAVMAAAKAAEELLEATHIMMNWSRLKYQERKEKRAQKP